MAGLTWFKLVDALYEQASRMPNSECQVVFVLPDGRTVEPKSASVELIQCVDRFDCIVKVKLEDKE